METAVPVSYSFSGHDMAPVAHRRMMAPLPDQSMAYYNNPAVSYGAPLHQQSNFGFGHILNNNQHQPSYQNFFSSNPPLTSNSPRLPSESAPTASPSHPQLPLSEAPRPAKNGLSRIITPPGTSQKVDDGSAIHQVTVQEKTAPAAPGEMKSSTGKDDIEFSTEVDTLMRAIQAKPTVSSPHPQQQHQHPRHPQQHPQPQLPPLQKQLNNAPPTMSTTAAWMHATYAGSMPTNQGLFTAAPQDRAPAPPNPKPRRRYECTLPGCRKSFFQKTHLDIHMRAHTGDKPFTCKEPGCEQQFSQLGNLRTHERRHTGEKPYSCEICHKTFAQRGNVRAHKITHQQAKPFTCRLDDCGKQFTQLGNLKSHQNKFHAQTIRNLTLRFGTMSEHERLHSQDMELWEYFSDLYKNSNKGIKGRGKDRRVSSQPKSRSKKSNNSHSGGSQNNSISISSGPEESSHLTPPGSDDDLRSVPPAGAGGGFGKAGGRYDRIPTANATTSYLGTPSSEEADFHEQMYQHPHHHHPPHYAHHHPHPPPPPHHHRVKVGGAP